MKKLWFCASILWAFSVQSAPWAGHEDGVWKLAISPNGEHLLSCGGDGSVKIWETGSLKLVSTFQHDKKWQVYDAAIFPDGERVLSTGFDASIYIWSLKTGERLHQVKGHTLFVPRVAMGASHFLTGGQDRLVKVWDAATYAFLGEIKTRSPVGIAELPESPDTLLVASMEGVHLWSVASGLKIQSYSDSSFYFALALLKGAFLTGGNLQQEGTLKRLALKDGAVVTEYKGLSGSIWQLTVSADQTRMASSIFRGPSAVWDVASGALVWKSPDARETIGVALSGDGKTLYLGDNDGTIERMELP